MDILFLLVPVSFILIIVAIRLFFWAVRDGQFDDLDGAAHSILFDKDKDLQPKVKTEAEAEEISHPENKSEAGNE